MESEMSDFDYKLAAKIALLGEKERIFVEKMIQNQNYLELLRTELHAVKTELDHLRDLFFK
jgi:hypothetical protein